MATQQCPNKDGECNVGSGSDAVVGIEDGAAFMSTVEELEQRWSVSFDTPTLHEYSDGDALRDAYSAVEELNDASEGGGTALAIAPLELSGDLARVSRRFVAYCSPCGHWFLVEGQ